MPAPTPSPTALDRAEAARLIRLERTVDRAVDVAGKIAGEALAIIRDERLYRVTHTTFVGYVEARWGFSESTAYRMIEAATAPQTGHKEVEGSSHGGRNPQPDSDPAGPAESDDDDRPVADPGEHEAGPAEPVDTWAEVINAGGGEMRLLVDQELPRYPETGQRVRVSW